MCVRVVCVWPMCCSAFPLQLKSVEDQSDSMKCSGMDETGNHQVFLLWIWLLVVMGLDGMMVLPLGNGGMVAVELLN